MSSLRATFAVSLLVAALGAPRHAHGVPLLTGFGGPEGFGPNNLPPNDDSSTGSISLTPAFPNGLHFFEGVYQSLFLNNNGNVTFGSSLFAYTPNAFPGAPSPMIAPWWGDVDTRSGGMPGRNGVYWYVGDTRFVATWHNVGYFNIHDDLQNDFQLVLADRPDLGAADFDVEFRYNLCSWTTGDASGGRGGFGGTPAQAGFDSGSTHHFYVLPGSLTQQILQVCQLSNVGVPGLWRFEIREGSVHTMPDPDAGADPFWDAGGEPDAGVCHSRHCPASTRLEGRAGPVGDCTCSIPGRPTDSSRGGAALFAAMLACTSARRRRRQSTGTGPPA